MDYRIMSRFRIRLRIRQNKGQRTKFISNESWLTRYAPKITNDITIYPSQIDMITSWLTQFSKDRGVSVDMKGLFIKGPSGCGKTTTIRAICKSLSYDVVYYNASHFKKKGMIPTILGSAVYQSGIDKLFGSPNPKVIIVDQVNILTQGMGNVYQELLEVLQPYKGKRSVTTKMKMKAKNTKRHPVICIGDDVYDKKIKKLESVTTVINFRKLTERQMIKIASNVQKKASMDGYPEINPELWKPIVQHVNGDIRQLLIMMEWVSNTSAITSETIHKAITSFDEKKIDMSIFEVCDWIMKENVLSRQFQIMETEPIMLPMMIQENLLSKSVSMDEMIAISDWISTGDILQTDSMYGWIQTQIANTCSVLAPIRLITSNNRTNKIHWEYPTSFRISSTKKSNDTFSQALLKEYKVPRLLQSYLKPYINKKYDKIFV